jgi:hypothetical protein
MRIPIILALIVIVTLPKDIRGLADDVSTQLTTASAAVTQFFDRGEEPLQVADLAGETSGTSVR